MNRKPLVLVVTQGLHLSNHEEKTSIMKKLLLAAALLTATLSAHALTYDCDCNQAAPYSVDILRSGVEVAATVGRNTYNFVQTKASVYAGASFYTYEMDLPEYVAHIELINVFGLEIATMRVEQKPIAQAYFLNAAVNTSAVMTAYCQGRKK